MASRSRAGFILLVTGVMATVMLVATQRLAPPVPHAVILVVVDTLRPDRLSCYGYDGHETPHIDDLAARGVLFTQANAVASWTVPSMGAMLTSRYPRQLGLIERPAPPDTTFAWDDKRDQMRSTIPGGAITLAEILRDADIATAAFVNQPGLNVGTGFRQGFDDWYFAAGAGRIVRTDAASPAEPVSWKTTEDAYASDRNLVLAFDRWLAERDEEQPVFAWIHLLTPHRPYNPVPAHAPPAGATEPSDFYDGEIRATDVLVGRIAATVSHHVDRENVLIIFVSDHAEAFGEHDMEEHGHTLHQEVTRVPLVIVGRGFPAGSRMSGRTRTIDIAPTVLDAFQLDIPSSFEGRALRPWMREGGEDLPVYAEAMLYGSSERSLTLGDRKIMVDEQRTDPVLFDVGTDPAELDDRFPAEAVRAAELRSELTSWDARLARALADLVREEGEPHAAERAEAERALRSLGYIR